MTNERAAQVLERLTAFSGPEIPVNDIYKAAELGAAALRAQQEPNEPLTYEQLQQMDGEPVYITGKHLAPSWDIVAIDYDHDWPIVYFHYKYRGALQRNGYGKTWRAYRRKPESEAINHE